MKKVMLIIIQFILNYSSYSQSPESGRFWSFERAESSLNSKGEFEGMGWISTKPGEYAFEFKSYALNIFSNGNPETGYAQQETYIVDERKRIESNDEKSVYEYYVHNKADSVKIVITVLNKDSYKGALIYVFKNPINSTFTEVLTYSCVRDR